MGHTDGARVAALHRMGGAKGASLYDRGMTFRWRVPQLQEPIPGAERGRARDLVKHCPRCEEWMPAESRICHYCLTNLSDVAAVRIEWSEAEVEPTSLGGRIRSVPRHRWLQLLLLATLAGVIYVQCFWPAPSRDQASGPRSVATGPGVWAAAGADAGATRVTQANPPLHGEIAWSRKLESDLTAPLVADEFAIYAAHRDARLVAFATADGSELWSYPVPGQLDDSPVIAGDTVYASLRSGGLVALEARTGRVRWRIDTGEDILSGAVVVDGIVWVGGRGVMLSYDAETGERLGGGASGDEVMALGGLAVGDERVIFRSWRRMHFFDIESGQHEFFARSFRTRHLVAGHGIVIGVSDVVVLAFDEDVPQPWWEGMRRAWFWAHIWGLAPPTPPQPLRWVRLLDCPLLAPVLQPAQVVFACEDGRVLAASLEDGVSLWEREGAPLVDAPALTAQGLLLIEGSALVVLDPGTGEEIDRRVMDGVSLSQVLVTSGAVYIVTADGELRALR